MDAAFTRRSDGQVDVSLGSEWPVFNDALNDSISSLPPRGAIGPGPSTYWIDIAETGVRAAEASGDESPFITGNETRISLKGTSVYASYDYEYGDDVNKAQVLELPEFLNLLARWRTEIQQSREIALEVIPETYRRTPHDFHRRSK
jgi:hypothetical protein